MTGERRKQVLQVIVGAGNVRYFTNCIRSVNNFDAGEIFAVYNWVSSRDLAAITAAQEEIQTLVQNLFIQRNTWESRTGSLYKANNLGLERAKEGFDYANFIQADMQMMWWDANVLERARKITNLQRDRGASSITFYTQVPVRGKKPSVYDGWNWDESFNTFCATGFTDVCLVPLYDGLNQNISFIDDEKSMSERLSTRKSALVYHPYPFLAPIPFPSNVRDPKTGAAPKSKNSRLDILRVNPEFSVDLNGKSLHPFVMEDAIFPNGWSCTTPYWPSDTTTSKWLRQKYRVLREDPFSLFEVRKANGDVSRWPPLRASPGVVRTLTCLAKLIAEETSRYFATIRRRKFGRPPSREVNR